MKGRICCNRIVTIEDERLERVAFFDCEVTLRRCSGKDVCFHNCRVDHQHTILDQTSWVNSWETGRTATSHRELFYKVCRGDLLVILEAAYGTPMVETTDGTIRLLSTRVVDVESFVTEVTSIFNPNFVYWLDKMVSVSHLDSNPFNTCGAGINCFKTVKATSYKIAMCLKTRGPILVELESSEQLHLSDNRVRLRSCAKRTCSPVAIAKSA